ncbi:MAG: hypothetical protein E7605_02365 [Ruminococcaceae bacterium]|nr:hypothetical protein [Oscillospiraceae bacterium]
MNIKTGTARAKQCEPGYEDVGSLAKLFTTSSLVCRRTTRGGGKDCPFCHATKRTKKRANGPNALWIPAVRHGKINFA